MSTPKLSFEDHIQWNAVKEVCGHLREAGYQALLAGGCVRDLLLGHEPNDFDVATDATPEEVESLFERSLAVGKAFGVIVLPFDDFQIEVATFREDLDYRDGRRPEAVKFSTPEADAKRRDFTVNALFYDPEKSEVIDYVAGRADLEKRILRTVGDPHHRFDEDKLRILRAVRFSAQLDFAIEPQTLAAVTERAHEVGVVSHERIRDELFKLLKSPRRTRGLKLLVETRLLEGAWPLVAPSIQAVKQKWLAAFEELEFDDDQIVLLALFLWPALVDAKNDSRATEILKSLRLSNQQADAVSHIFKHLNTALNPAKVRFGEFAFVLTKPFAPSLLMTADVLARAGALAHDIFDRAKWNEALKAARPDGHQSVTPIVSGKDLIDMGLKPGPHLGQTLQEIFLLQLEGTLKNRTDVQDYLKKLS